jgi:hypothetical protein
MAVLSRSTKRNRKSPVVVVVAGLLEVAEVAVANVAEVAVGIRAGSRHDCKGRSLLAVGIFADCKQGAS